MHLTTPSLEIQVTGEYTVKTVKSTREILKDAVSSFPTKSPAKPALPHSAPSPPQPPQSPCPVLVWPRAQPCSQDGHGPICQAGCCPHRAGVRRGCPTVSLDAGEPLCRLQKAPGAESVLAGRRLPPQEGAAAFPGNTQAGGQGAEGASGQGIASRAAFTACGHCRGGTDPVNPSQATFWKPICLAHFTRSAEGLLSCPLLSSPVLSLRAAHSELLLGLAPDAARERIQSKARSHRTSPRERSWWRTMENPEIHGGEARALLGRCLGTCGERGSRPSGGSTSDLCPGLPGPAAHPGIAKGNSGHGTTAKHEHAATRGGPRA